MAKSKKKKRGTKNEAIAVALLKRAAKRIEDSVTLPELAPGAYTSEVTASVQGTLTVGASSDPVTAPKVDNAEILGAIVQLCGEWFGEEFDLDEVAEDIVDLLVEDSSQVKSCLADLREAVALHAESGGYTKTTPARKGAVTGSPFVRLVGESSESSLELEVTGGEA